MSFHPLTTLINFVICGIESTDAANKRILEARQEIKNE